MRKILGLDLNETSIGWAMISDDDIKSYGVETVLSSDLNEKKHLSNQNRLTNALSFVKNNIKIITLILITIAMFLLSVFYPTDWQFWVNLGIGCLVASLSFSKK